MVELVCENCKVKFEIVYKYRNNRFCSQTCSRQFQVGVNCASTGKTHRTKATHPEWAEKVSKTHKERGTLIGDKNPMKNKDSAAKMAKTRREKVTSDPEYRQQRSEYTKQLWRDGKYDHVGTGKCKWYDHVRPNGEVVKLQGTWEVAFARKLDEMGVDYVAHRGRWTYIDAVGGERSYYPDFYVVAWDAYVDVKGVFWDEEQRSKLSYVTNSNPDKKLIVANKEYLNSMNVDLIGIQRELLSPESINHV